MAGLESELGLSCHRSEALHKIMSMSDTFPAGNNQVGYSAHVLRVAIGCLIPGWKMAIYSVALVFKSILPYPSQALDQRQRIKWIRCVLKSLLERSAVWWLDHNSGRWGRGAANLPVGFLLLSSAKKEIRVKPAEVFTAGPGPLNERLPC